MKRLYRVAIYYEGAIALEVEANDETEAQRFAEELFDEIDNREIVANLDEVIISEALEII